MIKKVIPLMFLSLAAFSTDLYAANIPLRMSWWGGDSRHEATNAGIVAFQSVNPGISVQAEFTGYGGHLARLKPQITGNTEPDVMQIDWNWMPVLSKYGDGFKDLNQYSAEIDLSQFDSAALAAGTNNGKLNGIPISMAARVFYLNRELWAKAGLDLPENWDDLLTAGVAFKQKLGNDYFPMVIDGLDTMTLLRSYMIQKHGVPMIDAENKEFAYSDAQMIEFFQLYADLVSAHVVPSSKVIASYGAANPYELKPWINGQWGGVYIWNTAISQYNNSLKPPMTLSLAPYLMLPKATDAGLFYKPALMFSIGKNSKHPEAAAMLINFLLNEKAGVEKLGLARGVPLSKKGREVLANNGTLVNSDLSVAGLAQINNLPKKVSASPYFELPELVSLFEEKIDLIDQGRKTVKEAASDFTKQGERILRKSIRSY